MNCNYDANRKIVQRTPYSVPPLKIWRASGRRATNMEAFMKTTKLIIGLVLLILSMGYLYKPNLILRLNDWGKRYIFNDLWVINYRWKTGVLFLVLSLIALYMGITAS